MYIAFDCELSRIRYVPDVETQVRKAASFTVRRLYDPALSAESLSVTNIQSLSPVDVPDQMTIGLPASRLVKIS